MASINLFHLSTIVIKFYNVQFFKIKRGGLNRMSRQHIKTNKKGKGNHIKDEGLVPIQPFTH